MKKDTQSSKGKSITKLVLTWELRSLQDLVSHEVVSKKQKHHVPLSTLQEAPSGYSLAWSLDLDSPWLSNSFIRGPPWNLIKVHRPSAMSHELPDNCRAPGRKTFLGRDLKETQGKACSPPRWLVVQGLLAKLLCFPKGEWKAGTPSWSKETGVSGKTNQTSNKQNTRLLFFLTVFL